MMRHSCIAVAGYFAIALLSLAGCGADEEAPAEEEHDMGQPPAPGPQQAGDGAGVALAIDRLFLGEVDRNGAKAPGSWKQFGFNLDGKVSSAASEDLCRPVAGATPADVYPDGDDGIDNSFGKNIVGLISNFIGDPSTEVTTAIANGDFTVILKIDELGAQSSYNPLTAKLYGGATLGGAPTWDGTDAWPVVPELLEDGQDIDSAKVVFPNSYVVDNTWVSGPQTQGTFKLNLTTAGKNIGLTISNVRIAMELAEDHKSAVKGTIAGVLETDVLVEELRSVIGAVQPALCEGTTLEGVLDQIRGTSDIMKDGSQDPSQECNAISIGIGFTAKEVQLGVIAPPAENTSVPCGTEPSDGEPSDGEPSDGG